MLADVSIGGDNFLYDTKMYEINRLMFNLIVFVSGSRNMIKIKNK